MSENTATSERTHGYTPNAIPAPLAALRIGAALDLALGDFQHLTTTIESLTQNDAQAIKAIAALELAHDTVNRYARELCTSEAIDGTLPAIVVYSQPNAITRPAIGSRRWIEEMNRTLGRF